MDFSIPDYEEFSRHLLKSKVKPEKRRQIIENLNKELEDSRHQSEISTVDVDLDNVKATKSYAEDQRKNFVVQRRQIVKNLDKEFEDSRHQSEISTVDVDLDNVKATKSYAEDQRKNFVVQRRQIIKNLDKEFARHQSEISTVDVDLDNVKATKSYAEDQRKNFVVPNSQQKQPHRELENLDLDQYASSLDEFSKRLMNMKRNKTLEDFKKNDELEAKLTQLCDNVNMFTQMFQSMAKLSEANKNWSPTQYNSTALQYDNSINQLLLGVNQVTYLLKEEQKTEL